MIPVFSRDGDAFICRIHQFPNLADAIRASLGAEVSPYEHGPTYTDPSEEAFWSITSRAAQQEALDRDFELVLLVLDADEVTEAELEAVLRVANAARLRYEPGDPRFDLLTALVAEAAEAMLG